MSAGNTELCQSWWDSFRVYYSVAYGKRFRFLSQGRMNNSIYPQLHHSLPSSSFLSFRACREIFTARKVLLGKNEIFVS